MNVFANRILNIAAVAAFVCVTAVSASAQQGTYRLPFEAKWAGVECPAGEYQVVLPERYAGKSTFLVRGPAGASFIVPMAADTYATQNPKGASLQLVKIDNSWFVRKFEEGSGGTAFYFKTPKPGHRVQIAAEESVTIAVTGD
jgi:hypothetical protein